jgi:adenosylcobinamide kinase/adenosylcobinamide-phosphate guanylyltransferase
VLIDGVILIDAPAEITAAVARAGADLRGLRIIAVTHAHHDHWDPSLLLHRNWIAANDAHLRSQPLTVLAPPAVLASAREWLPPDTDVTLLPAVIGQTHEVGQHRITVLPSTHGQVAAGAAADPWAVEAVLYEVRTDHAALLYAADTGPPDARLLTAVTAAAYDTVLLELTFGGSDPEPNRPAAARTPGHLDHDTFPATLQQFRDVGAITETTDVLAIHLGHHNPPAAELAATLSSWGARAVADGTPLLIGGPAPGQPPQRRAPLVLATGGARSGKSVYVEQRAAHSGRQVVYVATGFPASAGDPEWAARVADHLRRRPPQWRTVESADVAGALTAVRAGQCVIVDCLSLWLTRLIDQVQGWAEPAKAMIALDTELQRLVAALRTASERDVEVLMVTNEVGSGVVPASESGRLFRDLLGRLNARVAAICDETVLLVAGRPLVLPPAQKDPDRSEAKR